MKTSNNIFRAGFLDKLFLTILSVFMSALVFAQDGTKSVDVNINSNSGGGGFFGSVWVWVVGAAIFILLLVALLRGGGRKSA